MTMREAFEKKFPMPSQCIRCGDGYAATGYNAWEAQAYCSMWKGWQAAYAAGMERAAELIDGMNDKAGDRASYDTREMYDDEITRMHALRDCADAIRAEIKEPT